MYLCCAWPLFTPSCEAREPTQGSSTEADGVAVDLSLPITTGLYCESMPLDSGFLGIRTLATPAPANRVWLTLSATSARESLPVQEKLLRAQLQNVLCGKLVCVGVQVPLEGSRVRFEVCKVAPAGGAVRVTGHTQLKVDPTVRRRTLIPQVLNTDPTHRC